MFKLGAYKIVRKMIGSTYMPVFFLLEKKKRAKNQNGRRKNMKKKVPLFVLRDRAPRLTFLQILYRELETRKRKKREKGVVRGQKTLFRPTKHRHQLNQFDNFIKITNIPLPSGGQGAWGEEGGFARIFKQRMSLPSFESSTSETLQWRRCSSHHSRGSLHN